MFRQITIMTQLLTAIGDIDFFFFSFLNPMLVQYKREKDQNSTYTPPNSSAVVLSHSQYPFSMLAHEIPLGV